MKNTKFASIIIFLLYMLPEVAARDIEGCNVNGDFYDESELVYEDKEHCLKLQCLREIANNKTRYKVRTVPYENCECNTIPCPSSESCPLAKDPVCGNDGVFYTNRCFLGVKACSKKNLKEAANPKLCQVCPNQCPDTYSPVCGSDGVLYDNICKFQKVACITAGLVEATDPFICDICPDLCNAEYKPVCASNGMAFSNPCELRKFTCKENSSISLSLDPSLCGNMCPSCPSQRDPVCGSDDVTYINECSLKSVARPCGSKEIEVSYRGPCYRDCYDTVCNSDYDPICGTDGVLYENACKFYQEICTNGALREAGDPSVCKYCENANCTEKINPICGSNGITYRNICDLKAAICKDPFLSEAQDDSICWDSVLDETMFAHKQVDNNNGRRQGRRLPASRRKPQDNVQRLSSSNSSSRLRTNNRQRRLQCIFNDEKYFQRNTIKRLDSHCLQIMCGKKKRKAHLFFLPLHVTRGQHCVCEKTENQ
ncbi:hypothetical protein SK128_006360 [Halocaridina rubra]|uniref:Kazal-like domain-containing protein n=1 Tax=Halocaridina rubra TaxID=373956 RepID=A0AAN8ZT05_HALRR